MRVLAYRLQTDAFGGLDKSIQRMLASKKEQGAAVPFNRRTPQTRDGVRLKAGAMLVREWKGKLERVMILEDGFAWNGQTFGSLSQIARAMTGTNWNGHRFFGLRQAKTLVAMKQRDTKKESRARSDCHEGLIHRRSKSGPVDRWQTATLETEICGQRLSARTPGIAPENRRTAY